MLLVPPSRFRFQAGDLGPGTIVGSAAFNLLIITAVCIAGLPDNTTKAIKAIKVNVRLHLLTLCTLVTTIVTVTLLFIV